MKLVLEQGVENGYIHRVFDNDIETWTLYDEGRRLLHHRISDGRETWQSYDEKGNLAYAKDKYIEGDIFEQWWEYDNFGKMIKFKNSNGYEYDLTKDLDLCYKNKEDKGFKTICLNCGSTNVDEVADFDYDYDDNLVDYGYYNHCRGCGQSEK